ncbi:hypothetical protein BGZ73_003226 [Actinomortierella ambigua]|nr:hypothetical protein BGZ73_003226 [Actinomortierella ambigua]
MPTAAITNSSNNTSALTIPITIPSTTVSSGGGSGSLNYQQQSCAQLIKFPIYGANNKIKDVKYRCSQCPNLQFKLRATAKRHVDGHYAVATQIIQCMGCNARFARSDSCKRHLATPRYSECHQPDAVGRYRVYNIAANGNRTFREYVYPITKFYGTKSTKAVMPPEHTAQLAIVEERNRKIASKFPGHMAGYRPKDLTRMVESTFGEDPEDGKGGETVLVLAEEEESDSLIQVEEPTLQDKTVQWGAPMRESKA